MTSIENLTVEAADPAAATVFYDKAFGLGRRLQTRAAAGESAGFRGFTISLVVDQPSTVDDLADAAIDAGATVLKPVSRSFWGYGGVLQAPDGTIWKIASSSKKNTGSLDRREVDSVVLLLGVDDVKATKAFYVQQGLTVGKSYGSKYVEFTSSSPSAITLALYSRRAAAKDAGVAPEGSGSHRLVIGTDADHRTPFTDPDGFTWESAV